jgi:cytochrome c556
MPRPLTSAVLLVALTLLLPVGLSAQEAPPLAGYRGDLMTGMQAHQRALRALVGGDVAEPSHIVLHARALADITEMLQGVWAEGSGGEGSRALPAVWEDWADFQAKLEGLRSAARGLRDAAEGGDTEAVGATLQEVGQTCRDCHTTYRARAN